ncbi:MAG: DHH family phosphoesterase [Acidobacteriota bacterium]|nr:DHH family phosphoesterase [Acidobacteriota bacterium]MDE3265630.1 DHH family phosphoesterase [Acidobacteriota bacterium]
MNGMLSDLAQNHFAAFREHIENTDPRSRWLVLTHNNPDPDALAAAAILTKVLRSGFRRRVTAAYRGIIGRAENQEMVRSLDLDFSRARRLKLASYPYVALVDCQPATGNSPLPAERMPEVVIDHHPARPSTAATPFHDIRTDYAAAATIAAEYLLASGVPATRREATAIVYAIRSETLDFCRGSSAADRAIHDHFNAQALPRLLGRIQNPRLPLDYFQTLREALDNLYGVDSLILSRLGPVAQPDIVPEIADLLLRLEGCTWSMCSGLHEGRLYCSIRTTNSRANASRIMRRLVGRDGRGGGHGMIAGGWIPEAKGGEDAVRRQQDRLAVRLAGLLRKDPSRIVQISGP